jgi:hypothetical protein
VWKTGIKGNSYPCFDCVIWAYLLI